jgi:hypothetical protein
MALGAAGKLNILPDIQKIWQEGKGWGWKTNTLEKLKPLYNKYINANTGNLKAGASDMRPATGGASYGKGGVNYKDDIKSRYGSGGKIYIRTLKNGGHGYYLMTEPGKYWPIVNVSRNKATSKVLYHINTAFPYNNARARQPRRQLGVSS